MSNINIALWISELIIAGKMPNNEKAVSEWLKGVFDDDRKRIKSVIHTLKNEFQVQLV